MHIKVLNIVIQSLQDDVFFSDSVFLLYTATILRNWHNCIGAIKIGTIENSCCDMFSLFTNDFLALGTAVTMECLCTLPAYTTIFVWHLCCLDPNCQIQTILRLFLIHQTYPTAFLFLFYFVCLHNAAVKVQPKLSFSFQSLSRKCQPKEVRPY